MQGNMNFEQSCTCSSASWLTVPQMLVQRPSATPQAVCEVSMANTDPERAVSLHSLHNCSSAPSRLASFAAPHAHNNTLSSLLDYYSNSFRCLTKPFHSMYVVLSQSASYAWMVRPYVQMTAGTETQTGTGALISMTALVCRFMLWHTVHVYLAAPGRPDQACISRGDCQSILQWGQQWEMLTTTLLN